MNNDILKIDLNLLNNFIHSANFYTYILNQVPDVNTAIFIITTLQETCERLKRLAQGHYD